MSTREHSRLEVDDERFCKNCGKELPEMLVNGPIAGDGTDTEAVELCGSCEAGRTFGMGEDGYYCGNCGKDLRDPKNSGFPFDDKWYCSAFCAEVAARFWSRNYILEDGVAVSADSGTAPGDSGGESTD